MAIVMKTKHWCVKDFINGYGVFAEEFAVSNNAACEQCVEEALAGDLEAVVAIQMCGVDEMLMDIWEAKLKEQDKCKPKA